MEVLVLRLAYKRGVGPVHLLLLPDLLLLSLPDHVSEPDERLVAHVRVVEIVPLLQHFHSEVALIRLQFF